MKPLFLLALLLTGCGGGGGGYSPAGGYYGTMPDFATHYETYQPQPIQMPNSAFGPMGSETNPIYFRQAPRY